MWEQYRNYQALAELTDGMDPAAMWVSARRGDEGYRLQRLPGRDWEVTLSDLSRDPSDDSNLFDPGDSAHRAMAEELRSYKRLLEGDARESMLREEPISEARNVLLLKLLGYIE